MLLAWKAKAPTILVRKEYIRNPDFISILKSEDAERILIMTSSFGIILIRICIRQNIPIINLLTLDILFVWAMKRLCRNCSGQSEKTDIKKNFFSFFCCHWKIISNGNHWKECLMCRWIN